MKLQPHIWTRAQDGKPTGLFPLMVRPSPDTAERVRLEVQAIPFALPQRKKPAESADG